MMAGAPVMAAGTGAKEVGLWLLLPSGALLLGHIYFASILYSR